MVIGHSEESLPSGRDAEPILSDIFCFCNLLSVKLILNCAVRDGAGRMGLHGVDLMEKAPLLPDAKMAPS